MSEISLNKFEKEGRVIELHKEGKTIRDIAKNVHMSFTPISKLIKKYDKKQTVKLNNNNSIQMRKLLKCTKAYALFQKGYNTVQTSIDLQLDFNEVRKYWSEYLRLKNMTKLYNIYIESEYHLDYLFKIYYFFITK